MGPILTFLPASGTGVAKQNMIRGMWFLAVAAVIFCLAGCTDIERRGYSPIPQNSPPAWSSNPYGDFHN